MQIRIKIAKILEKWESFYEILQCNISKVDCLGCVSGGRWEWPKRRMESRDPSGVTSDGSGERRSETSSVTTEFSHSQSSFATRFWSSAVPIPNNFDTKRRYADVKNPCTVSYDLVGVSAYSSDLFLHMSGDLCPPESNASFKYLFGNCREMEGATGPSWFRREEAGLERPRLDMGQKVSSRFPLLNHIAYYYLLQQFLLYKNTVTKLGVFVYHSRVHTNALLWFETTFWTNKPLNCNKIYSLCLRSHFLPCCWIKTF